jgi:hypothetical protein
MVPFLKKKRHPPKALSWAENSPRQDWAVVLLDTAIYDWFLLD